MKCETIECWVTLICPWNGAEGVGLAGRAYELFLVLGDGELPCGLFAAW
jgi:hypothetical protein